MGTTKAYFLIDLLNGSGSDEFHSFSVSFENPTSLLPKP
jgi:hypothetical protein